MRTRLVLAVLPVALLGVAVAPSSAAGPKPMKGEYTASAPVPGAPDCDGTAPGSTHTESIKVPAAGRFTAELGGFLGDWDFYLKANGGVLSSSTSGGIGGAEDSKEIVTAKIKKAGTIDIVSCNWSGGPTGAVTWSFVPNK